MGWVLMRTPRGTISSINDDYVNKYLAKGYTIHTKQLPDYKQSESKVKSQYKQQYEQPRTSSRTAVKAAVDTSKEQKRRNEVNKLTLSSVPEIAALQKQSQDIYVQTGRWDTPEQKQLHAAAENIRKGTNPLYPGSADGGNEGAFILPPSEGFGLGGFAASIPVTLVALAAVLLIGRR